jgi:hypothetical protein
VNEGVSGGQGGTPLQFEQAEFKGGEGARGGRACGRCTRGIDDEYYEAGGHVLCKGCADELAGRAAGEGARWWRALLHGSGAAVLGTLVWFAIIKILDMELGLIAVAVGLFVGLAVRKGSRGRGGWKYQALAMALTYASITAAYAPFVVKGMFQAARKHHDQSSGKPVPSGAAAAGPTGTEAAAAAPSAPPAMSAMVALPLFLLLVAGLALVSPFLGGASNIMGLIIIGIALYEAWKINRRVNVTGPFRATAPAPAAGPPAP